VRDRRVRRLLDAAAFVRALATCMVGVAHGKKSATRLCAVSNIYRRVAKDIVCKVIELRTGEKVVLPNTVANRNPSVFEKPERIDFDRKINAFVTFGLGPHRCIGSHLAKAEVVIALQEWLPRIPEF